MTIRDENDVWSEYQAETQALREQAKLDSQAAFTAVWEAFYAKVTALRNAAEASLVALESEVAEARAQSQSRAMDKARV